MKRHARCRLTFRDWAILRAMLDRRAADDPLATLLRQKLSASDIVSGEELAPDVVTLDSRIVFSADDGPAHTRILVRAEAAGSVGLTIPVTSPRGLALLGMSKDETGTVARDDGSAETIRVEDVLFQPDAAKWSAQRRSPDNRLARRPVLTLVHNADPSLPSPQALQYPRGGGNDDPGPSAA